MSFESLGLEPRLLSAITKMGYTEPTPIQSQAIPHILEGQDVVGVAQTGTGKTAAFVLPTLQKIPAHKGVRALIVTPTRELALQIAEVVNGASRNTGHKCVVIIGGVGMGPQIQKLRRGVDVVIACPGRLIDIQQRGAVDLSRVETLVLDEADRMLDMGFWPQVRQILALLPAKRQNLLFSATMSPQVLDIVKSTLREPVRIEVSPSTKPVDRIEQTLYPVARDQKTALLLELLKSEAATRTLVFTRTKHRADRLARQLSRAGVSSSAIHGDRSQSQRQTALDGFKRGRHSVLVATDVASRGIDVDEITHVVNYDLPNTAEDYVHRIGRTARAGASGTAISFMSAEEVGTLADIEKVLGCTIACEDLEGFKYDPRIVPDPDRPAVPAKGKGGHRSNGNGGGNNGGGNGASRRSGRRGGSARRNRSEGGSAK